MDRQFSQASLAHEKKPELIRRAEAILARPQHPQGILGLLETDHGIDKVLGCFRTSNHPVLRDMGHKHHNRIMALRPLHKLLRAEFDLVRRARNRPRLRRMDGLDRIDHCEQRMHRIHHRQTRVQVIPTENLDLFRKRSYALGSQANLRRRFLARNVERLALCAKLRARFQKQRALADARLAPDKNGRAAHKTAA
jgi:hypothetical protein